MTSEQHTEPDERGARISGGVEESGLGDLLGGIDPGTTDLGDDVNRTPSNSGSILEDQHSTLEGGIDAGTTDLGDDGERLARGR